MKSCQWPALFPFFFFDRSPPFFDVPVSRAQPIEEVLQMARFAFKTLVSIHSFMNICSVWHPWIFRCHAQWRWISLKHVMIVFFFRMVSPNRLHIPPRHCPSACPLLPGPFGFDDVAPALHPDSEGMGNKGARQSFVARERPNFVWRGRPNLW